MQQQQHRQECMCIYTQQQIYISMYVYIFIITKTYATIEWKERLSMQRHQNKSKRIYNEKIVKVTW